MMWRQLLAKPALGKVELLSLPGGMLVFDVDEELVLLLQATGWILGKLLVALDEPKGSKRAS